MSRSKVNTAADVNEFRIIPSSKYEFGCNDEGTPKKRLIVFEDDNQAYVRQYTDLGTTKNLWSCLNCKKNSKFNNNLFMAPTNHTCTPITYQEAIEQQNLIKAKKAPKQNVGGGGNAEESDDVQINPTYINSLSKLEILPSNYEFGVDIKNTLNARVFVFEEHDRNFGRQYGKQGDKYFCRGCFYLVARKVYAFFKDENIFCVPPIHLCNPRKYEEVMEEQQKIKEKFETIENEAAVIASTASTSSSSPRVLLSIKPAIASISLQTNPITEEELNRLRNSANNFPPSFLPIPSPPINVLPGFRLVDIFEFEYGFNEHGECKKRILVRETDRKFVREYYSTETGIWQCLNCSIGTATKSDDYFCVSIEHECEPIPLKLSKERQSTYQVLYKALSTAASPNSINNDSFSRNQLSRFSFEYVRRSSGNSARVTKRMGAAENAGYSNGMMANKRARNSMGQPSFLNNSNTSTSQLLGNISINGSQRYQPSNPTTTVKLYKPSSFTLEKLCQKLGIDYSDNAYQFWLNTNIKQISPSSIPDEIYSVTTTINPGFSSISLFLTGSETFASKIKEELNKYFIVNHKTLGESLGQDLARLDHPLVSQTLFQESATELHFETIIHLFQCRIGIFCDGKWKRYGNWNETNADIPIFLMEKKNDNYFPILSLKN